MTGWASFTLLVTVVVLLVLEAPVATVLWVLVAGLLVAGALLLSARLSPLAPVDPDDAEPDRRRPPAP